jgi:(S)-mandelate dehydrogenase
MPALMRASSRRAGMAASTQAHSIEDLRRLARRRLPRAVFDFFDGGAEDEWTLRANRRAFERRGLRPRVLVDVTTVDTATELVGAPSALPIAVAPTGAVGFGWPGGDIAIARAAAAAGVPYTLSTTATASIEAIARSAPGRLWFQAYVLQDAALFEALIHRADAAGYEALMITVDLPVGGKRERDLRNHFAVPFRFTPRNLWDFACHPRWALRLLFHGVPRLENLAGVARGGVQSKAGSVSSVGSHFDAGFDWRRLEQLRHRWPRKLIVKGVAHPDDAQRLVALGADAIVVSNHGGRQLDGAAASLDLLPDVVAAVGGRVPVLVDGGVRRGTDVVKARALGAQGVLVGRATLYGAAADGEAGARRALTILDDEIVRTLRLCGLRHIDQVGPGLLAPTEG